MGIALAVALIIALMALWSLNLVSLPGNWLCALLTAIYWYFAPVSGAVAISGWVVVVVVGLTALAEFVEFIASSLGATKAGGSKRAAILALFGSIAGAMIGGVVGSPFFFPVGTVLGAIVGGGIGAMMGAILGEAAKGRGSGESWQVGKAAFWGRIFGSLAKSLIGAFAVALVMAAVCW